MSVESAFEIVGPSLPPDLTPQELVVRESVNAPFVLRALFTCPAGQAAPAAELLGSRITCRFRGRTFHGIVTHVGQRIDNADGRAVFELYAGPPFADLAHRIRSRLFQHRTTSDVLAQILAEGGQPHESRVSEELGERAYVCQYHEADATFAQRILAEDGVFFWFEHPATEDCSTLVTADGASVYRPIDGDPRLVARVTDAGTGLALDERSITTLRRDKRVGTDRVVRRDFDHERPLATLEDRSSESTALRLETYHAGSAEQTRVLGVPARRRLEGLRRDVDRLSCESLCPRLAPGRWFELDDQLSGGDALEEFVVASIDHYVFDVSVAPYGRTYYNQFEARPRTAPLRPEPASTKPRATSETAIVVGPEGEDIHTDALGRVKVRFHWDTDAPADESASCWLRVQQPWSGAGFGTQFVPRVGTEVLVSFLGGDPHRPIVTGCLYDGILPPPFQLPEQKRKSGFRTRSTGPDSETSNGGCHELGFDDTAGAELLTLRSQRDLLVSAPGRSVFETHGDATSTIGGHGTHTTAGDHRHAISGAAEFRVAGAALGDFAQAVALTALDSATVAVRGAASARYGDGLSTFVEGERRTTIAGKDGNRTRDALSIDGDHRLGASGNVAITAGESIVLRCGESVLRLLPDRILIDSPTIQIAGKREVSAFQGRDRSAGWKIDGAFGIAAKTINLASSGASLKLDADAHLDGGLVLLNCGGAAPPMAAKGAPSDKPGAGVVRVLPRNLPPGTEVVLVLSDPEGNRVEKKCVAGESVSLTGPEGGLYAVLEARVGDKVIPLRTIEKEKSNV